MALVSNLFYCSGVVDLEEFAVGSNSVLFEDRKHPLFRSVRFSNRENTARGERICNSPVAELISLILSSTERVVKPIFRRSGYSLVDHT